MKRCHIFGSAEINDYSGISIAENDFIIAADGGYEHLRNINKVPDLLLGDFDSIKSAPSAGCEIINVPAEKDDTDMMLAVKEALDRDYDDIIIYGGLGGRLDHTIAGIQTLEYINSHGANGMLWAPDNEASLITSGSYTYLRRDNWYISVFALSATALITTRGTKYNLTDHQLTRQFPLGVSNEITDDFCSIDVFSGVLLVIFSRKKD